ncbi:MAG: DnaD domain protein [Clostridium sp.]
MFEGWIKLYRKIFKSEAWKVTNPSEKVVLITLLLLAQFKEREVVFGGESRILSPGTLCFSCEELLEFCGKGFLEEDLKGALEKLCALNFLRFFQDGELILVEIINFSSYQEGSHTLGWIKLHRCLLKNNFWRGATSAQKVIFITFLLMANAEAGKWICDGAPLNILEGEFVTTINSIVEICGDGVTCSKVRTSFKVLELYNLISINKSNRYHKIIIMNWSKYQVEESQKDDRRVAEESQKDNRRVAKESQKSDRRIALNNKDNKGNKGNKENKDNNTKNKEGSLGVVCDVEFKNKDIYDYFSQSGFGLINHTISQMLDSDVEIFGKVWVKDAIDLAVKNGRFKLSYVEGILRNWKRDGRGEKHDGITKQNTSTKRACGEGRIIPSRCSFTKDIEVDF